MNASEVIEMDSLVARMKKGLLELEAMPLDSINHIVAASVALSGGDLRSAVSELIKAHEFLATTVTIFKMGVEAGMIPQGDSINDCLEEAVSLYGGMAPCADDAVVVEVDPDKLN